MGSQVVVCPGCDAKNRIPDVGLGRPGCASCQRALPWIVEADDATFVNLADSDLLVLVEVYAAWSKPSGLVSPLVREIARDYAGRLKVVRVNADTAPRLLAAYRLKGPPTLLVMKNGAVVESLSGAQPDATVRKLLEGVLFQRV